MLNLYWGLLLGGAVLAVFSLFFNCLDGGLDFGVDIFLPMRTSFVLMYLTAFGGIGIIASSCLIYPLHTIVALIGAYFVARPIDYLLFTVLKSYEKEALPTSGCINLSATVLENITSDEIGSIWVHFDGRSFSLMARAEKGSNGFRRNQVVRILKIEEQIAIVGEYKEEKVEDSTKEFRKEIEKGEFDN